ncbi:hypothetical protein ACFLSQ_11085, partial [Bacteroidota bacterium]
MQIQPIEIMFSPSKEGDREANIEIEIPGLKLTRKITGQGFQPELTAASDYIDFQKVEIGDFIDSTVNLIVKNISKKTVRISSVEILGSDDEHFFIIDGAEPKALLPEEGYDITLRFMPEFTSLSNARLVFKYDGTGQETFIYLLGEG